MQLGVNILFGHNFKYEVYKFIQIENVIYLKNY